MSSGKTHTAVTLALTPACALAAANWGGGEAAWSAAVGCLATVAVNPDLDQEGMSSVEADILRYTAGFGAVWLGLWWLYAAALPHRSFLSHFPVVGTLGRLLYLAMYTPVFLGMHLLLASLVPWITVDWPPVSALWDAVTAVAWRRMLWAVLAMCASDTVHWMMDGMPVR